MNKQTNITFHYILFNGAGERSIAQPLGQALGQGCLN